MDSAALVIWSLVEVVVPPPAAVVPPVLVVVVVSVLVLVLVLELELVLLENVTVPVNFCPAVLRVPLSPVPMTNSLAPVEG